MEAFGEYRVGHNPPAHKHWVECRGEVIAYVKNVRHSGQMDADEVVWHYGDEGKIFVKSEIPGWDFEAVFPSIGHGLVDIARSHRRFVEPNPLKRLRRELALWPLWGKMAAVVVFLGAVAEVLGFLRAL